jgi:hypothetical protein
MMGDGLVVPTMMKEGWVYESCVFDLDLVGLSRRCRVLYRVSVRVCGGRIT